jgi:hypothetical protein
MSFEYARGPPAFKNPIRQTHKIIIVGKVTETNFGNRYGNSLHSTEIVDLGPTLEAKSKYDAAFSRYASEMGPYHVGPGDPVGAEQPKIPKE